MIIATNRHTFVLTAQREVASCHHKVLRSPAANPFESDSACTARYQVRIQRCSEWVTALRLKMNVDREINLLLEELQR